MLLIFLIILYQVSITKTQRLHEGVHLQLITQEPGIIQNVLRHKEAFEEYSGATLNIVTFPTLDLFAQIMSDLRDGSVLYDGFIFPPLMMVDFIECTGCSLEILTERVRVNEQLAWYDITPYFRSHNSVYAGEVYTITLDGDVHFLYYNMEILKRLNRTVPRTWEEYAEISALANNHDWNSDGVLDYGSCITRPRQLFLFMVVSSYMQSKGSDQGIYFNVDTMDPLIDSEPFREGLAMYMLLRDLGPPLNETSVSDVFNLMIEGRCAFAPTWGNIGPRSRDTKDLPTSTWDKIGASITPGINRAWDWEQEIWHYCEKEPDFCPFSSEETEFLNRAPFATGGWSGAIPVNIPDERKNAMFDFYTFLSANSNEDVMAGTGFEPYRNEHFNIDLWIESGFEEGAAEAQISGVSETLNSRNLVVNLRIQGSNEYTNVIVENELTLLNNDEITQDEFISRVYDGWQEMTDSTGRREILQQYRATIGLEPKNFDIEVEVTREGRIILATIAGIFAICCIILTGYVYIHKKVKVWLYASPFFLFTSLVGSIISYIGIILMSVNPSTDVCTSAIWLFITGMSLILGGIFAKTFRIWSMFYNSRRFHVVVLKDIHIFPITAVIVILAIIILVAWTIIDAPTSYKSTEGVDDNEYVIICNSENYGIEFFATTIAYFGFLLLIALILSFSTRNVGNAFNEARMLGLCVYNLTQVLIIVVVAVLSLDSPNARYILVVMCLMFGVTVTTGLLFIPKVWATMQGKGNDVETTGKTSQSISGGETGARGDFGETGDRGDFGETGTRGDFGETGTRGDFGETGGRGDFGETTSTPSQLISSGIKLRVLGDRQLNSD